MWPQSNHVGAASSRGSPPRPTPTPATEVAGQPMPHVDEHGGIHGVLAGDRAAPARGWAGLPPGYFDGQEGPSSTVPPRSPATVMRIQGEDSSGEEDSGGAAFSFVENDDDLVHLAIEKSLRSERRQVTRRRRYEQHLEAFNARQLEHGLRADTEVQAKKREWDTIAASQFDHVGFSSSCSSSDSGDN